MRENTLAQTFHYFSSSYCFFTSHSYYSSLHYLHGSYSYFYSFYLLSSFLLHYLYSSFYLLPSFYLELSLVRLFRFLTPLLSKSSSDATMKEDSNSGETSVDDLSCTPKVTFSPLDKSSSSA